MRSIMSRPLGHRPLSLAFLVLLSSAAAAPPAEAETVNACIGKKLACVRTLVTAIDGCYAKAATAGQTLDAACVAKAAAKLTGEKGCIAKAEKKGGCVTTGDADALVALATDFVQQLTAALDPGRRCSDAR